jgi:hypothetical protein
VEYIDFLDAQYTAAKVADEYPAGTGALAYVCYVRMNLDYFDGLDASATKFVCAAAVRTVHRYTYICSVTFCAVLLWSHHVN